MDVLIDRQIIHFVCKARSSLAIFSDGPNMMGAHSRLPYTGKLRIAFAQYSMSSQDFVLWISSIPTIDFVFTSFFQRIPTRNEVLVLPGVDEFFCLIDRLARRLGLLYWFTLVSNRFLGSTHASVPCHSSVSYLLSKVSEKHWI